MYTFVRFADLGPFSNIVHSHPRYMNTPSGLIRDVKGRVLGHSRAPLSTRRFGTFEGTAGETLAAALAVRPAPISPGGSESDSSVSDDEYSELSESEVEDLVEKGLDAAKDDDVSKFRSSIKEEAKRQGLSAALTRQVIKVSLVVMAKHKGMELKDVVKAAIAAVRKNPVGKPGGRPSPKKSGTAAFRQAVGRVKDRDSRGLYGDTSLAELKGVAKMLGLRGVSKKSKAEMVGVLERQFSEMDTSFSKWNSSESPRK